MWLVRIPKPGTKASFGGLSPIIRHTSNFSLFCILMHTFIVRSNVSALGYATYQGDSNLIDDVQMFNQITCHFVYSVLFNQTYLNMNVVLDDYRRYTYLTTCAGMAPVII